PDAPSSSAAAAVSSVPLSPEAVAAAPPPEPPVAKVTGTLTSAVRSPARVWSAPVPMTQPLGATCGSRQSVNASFPAMASVTEKEPLPPDAVNRTARHSAEAGGLGAVHAAAPPAPPLSPPPRHGLGALPAPLSTHSAT